MANLTIAALAQLLSYRDEGGFSNTEFIERATTELDVNDLMNLAGEIEALSKRVNAAKSKTAKPKSTGTRRGRKAKAS